jgi:hypothetical protein
VQFKPDVHDGKDAKKRVESDSGLVLFDVEYRRLADTGQTSQFDLSDPALLAAGAKESTRTIHSSTPDRQLMSPYHCFGSDISLFEPSYGQISLNQE